MLDAAWQTCCESISSVSLLLLGLLFTSQVLSLLCARGGKALKLHVILCENCWPFCFVQRLLLPELCAVESCHFLWDSFEGKMFPLGAAVTAWSWASQLWTYRGAAGVR